MVCEEELKEHLVLKPRFDIPEEELEDGVRHLMDIFDGDSEFYEYIKSNRKYLLDKFCILDDYTDKDDAIIVWHDILKKSLKYGKWNTNNEIKNELFEAFQQCDDFLRSTSTFWKVAPSFMEWRLPVSDPLYRKHHKLVRIDESVNGEEK